MHAATARNYAKRVWAEPDYRQDHQYVPQFQLRWLDDDRKAHAHSLLYQYVSTLEQQTERESQPCSVSGSASLEDDFFCLDSQLADTADTRAEVDVYLTDTSCDIASLHSF